MKNTDTTVCDSQKTRVFIKGIEITDLLSKITMESNPGPRAGPFVSLILEITGISVFQWQDDEQISIRIGDYPTDEFIAEMVRLKFKREGIME